MRRLGKSSVRDRRLAATDDAALWRKVRRFSAARAVDVARAQAQDEVFARVEARSRRRGCARVLVGGKLPFERFRAKPCCTQRVPPCDGCPWDVLLRLMSPRSSPPGAPAKLLLQLRSNYLDRYVSRPASADRICRCER